MRIRVLPIGRHRLHHRVGGLRDRGRDAATRAIALDREGAPVALLPGHAQRMREQRQGSGLARHVAQDQLHEARLESQPGHPCGLGDRALELLVAHRPEQDLVVRDRPRQLRVVAQPPVQVGAHADHDRRGEREQPVDERVAARRVLTQRVELLELVDDDQLAAGRPSPRAAARRRG